MADHLLSHLNLVAAEGLPFAILALLHAAEDGGWGLGVGGWREPTLALDCRGGAGAGRDRAVRLAIRACSWRFGRRSGGCGSARRWLPLNGRSSGRDPNPEPTNLTSNPLGPALAWALFLLLVSPARGGHGAGNWARPPASTFTGLAQETITYSADLLGLRHPQPVPPLVGGRGPPRSLRPFPGTLIEKVMFPTYTGAGPGRAGLGRRAAARLAGGLLGGDGRGLLRPLARPRTCMSAGSNSRSPCPPGSSTSCRSPT